MRAGLRVLFGFLLGCALPAASPGAVEPGPLAQVLGLREASLLVEEGGVAVIARQADQPRVPASTMKLLTALAAIERWGLEHRFETDLYRGDDGRLWVRGSGDPFLVSEDLDRLALEVKARGLDRVAGIGTDSTRYAAGLDIPGRSASDNPYDAPLSALAVNFNTLHVLRTRGGVQSAEEQTPLTALAAELGRELPPGKHRVNLRDGEAAARYFAELLAAKLRAAGVVVGEDHRDGALPRGARAFHRYRSGRDLGTLIASMLEYSNNFVANGLFLALGDRGDGRPLTLEAAQEAFAAWADRRFGWRGYRVEEGAGLSRGNRLSARQLVDVLRLFAPYRELLPAQDERIRAKTGTLRGISCYAGYVQRAGRWEPFALLINQPVAYELRRQVADSLARTPDLARVCPGASC